ncbi:MAG: DUF115 domain-containing protein [Asgard group archaeon]|nr:DUF115 domain-containing protein [Asgard group archaeon]
MAEFLALDEKDYEEICKQLDISPKTDFEATRILSRKLKTRKVKKALKKLPNILSDKIVLIFGAGPSIIKSIEKLGPFIKKFRNELAIIGIDGATQALIEKQISSDIVISDLDGGLKTLRDAHNQGSILVIHSHGDNIPKIKRFSSYLKKDNIIGSTQVNSTQNVINFGGFTDGDRGVFLAAGFPNLMIILIAFDFGEFVGRYSKPDYKEDIPIPERKEIKFTIAKRLLEKLVELKPSIQLFSFENKIVSIKSIEKISISELEEKIAD